MDMEEIWKDIEGYEGMYQVSSLGNVRSLNRIVRHNYGGDAHKVGKLKTVSLSKRGYRFVSLYKNNTIKGFRVCRLVYAAFVGPIPEGMQVNHIDECKTNDAVWNLNLMTPKENSNWGTRNHRISVKLAHHSLPPSL